MAYKRSVFAINPRIGKGSQGNAGKAFLPDIILGESQDRYPKGKQ